MNKHYGLLHIPDTTPDETTLPAWYVASDVDARIAELEKALRYWIADESLVTQEHQAAWGEHVKLLSSSL